MKILILILIYLSAAPSRGADRYTETQELRQIELEQIQRWEDEFVKSLSMNSVEKMNTLGLGLRNLGGRRIFQNHNPNFDAIYHKIQNAFFAIPEHAQYYADEIERERKTVEHLRPMQGPRNDYDRNRSFNFEVLANLPSPETIRVLGEFLADDRDNQSLEYILGLPRTGYPANSIMAANAFTLIGLRNPVSKPPLSWDYTDLNLWRKWYAEVKAGRLAFSFVGQQVEYRFKPDGTVETTPVNIQDPPPPPPVKYAQSIPEFEDNQKKPMGSAAANKTGQHWPWIIGGGLVLFAGSLWFTQKLGKSY